jgi:hypothetical protein
MLSHYDLRRNYPNGDRYNGEATENNVKDGKGTFVWGGSGRSYQGTWSKDAMHGGGTLIDPRPDCGFTFVGAFVKGKRQGRGELTTVGGRNYVGDWADDEMSGRGVLKSSSPSDDFSLYEGFFVEGMRHGDGGACKYNNGDRYKGAWQADAMNGGGSLLLATGDEYSGALLMNAVTGVGIWRYADAAQTLGDVGATYDGAVSNRLRHGSGTLTSGATVYQGEFGDNLRSGCGVLTVAASSAGVSAAPQIRYDGTWRGDRWNGWGTLTMAPGSTASRERRDALSYDGLFSNDQFHGDKGDATFADGSSYRGPWARGAMQGHGSLDRYPSTAPRGVGSYVGAFDGGLRHGQGRATIADGPLTTTYDGDWANGLPCGNGALSDNRGFTFTGEMRDGEPHGRGRSEWKHNGNKYTGEFSCGKRHGDGRMSYPNGDHYDGAWRCDEYDGVGSWRCELTGDTYRGEWRGGKRHGDGTAVEYGKSHYTGGYRNDERCGAGTLKYSNGTKYDGDFASGVYDGRGALAFPDGLAHKGEFRGGLCHGSVETTFVNGNTYDGNYVRGVVSGRGAMKYANGDRYDGEFVDGQRCGHGTMRFPEGHTLECIWNAKGLLHGRGVYAARDGGRAVRVYDEGAMVSEAPVTEAGPFEPRVQLEVSPNVMTERPSAEGTLRQAGQQALTAVAPQTSLMARPVRSAPVASKPTPVTLRVANAPPCETAPPETARPLFDASESPTRRQRAASVESLGSTPGAQQASTIITRGSFAGDLLRSRQGLPRLATMPVGSVVPLSLSRSVTPPLAEAGPQDKHASPDSGAAMDDAAGRVLARIAAASRQIDEMEVTLARATASTSADDAGWMEPAAVRQLRRRLPLLRASRNRDEKKLESLLAVDSPYREE